MRIPNDRISRSLLVFAIAVLPLAATLTWASSDSAGTGPLTAAAGSGMAFEGGGPSTDVGAAGPSSADLPTAMPAPIMGAEDFSYPANHSDRVVFDEPWLAVGVAMYAHVALEMRSEEADPARLR